MKKIYFIFLLIILYTGRILAYEGTGTKADPYLINNRVELEQIKDYLGDSSRNTYFRLMNDIDLSGSSWVPIGDQSNPFQGKFDGNSKSINNLSIGLDGVTYQWSGMFGYLGNGAKIENLTVKNSNIRTSSSGYHWSGGITGYARCGGNNTSAEDTILIHNCHHTGTIMEITSDPFKSTGGIVGEAVSDGYGKSTIIISECTSDGVLSGTGDVGGIIGFGSVTGSSAPYDEKILSEFRLIDCQNQATVFSEGSAGGIIGAMNIQTAYLQEAIFVMSGLHNAGAVTSDFAAGGIAGGYNAMDEIAKIEQCTNNGEIFGSMYAGGILSNAANVLLFQCINAGKIKGGATGGIAGEISGESVELTQCINNGIIEPDFQSLADEISLGGIIGYAQIEDYFVLSQCINNGDLIGAHESINCVAGGLVGIALPTSGKSLNIKGSYTYAFSITGSTVGAIIGEIEGQYQLEDNFFLQSQPGLLAVSGETVTTGVTSLSSQQFRNQDTFVGWDFTSPDGWSYLKEKGNIYDYTRPYPAGIDTVSGVVTVRFTENTNVVKLYDGGTSISDPGSVDISVKGSTSILNVDMSTFTGVYDDPSLGTGKTVQISGYALQGEESGKYLILNNLLTDNVGKIVTSVTGKILVTLDVSNSNALVTIYRIEPEEKEIVPVDTARYDGGMYHSDGLPLGEYLVGVENVSGYLPTYHTNALIWNQADTIRLKEYGQILTVSVKLNKIPEIGSGDITIEGNVYDASSVKARVAMNSTVGIYRSTKSAQKSEDWELVRKVRPDANGYYRFDNLPAGVYKVVIDLPGYTLQGNGIEIDAKAGNVYTANDFMVDEVHKTINDVTTSAPVYENAQLNIYPNPFDGEIRISGLEGPYVIRIYDLLGRVVVHKKGSAGEEVLDMGRLPSGIYIIRLEAGGTNISRKIIKNK
ncbi:MAG: T9SS type A sorting domain-containing protein [Bacteroidales bacterium]|nr:T9SS type A sorting domain-containing protein [Bacteroidales bacterium]